MVKPIYNFPEDPSDDRATAEHWLASLPANYPEPDRKRLQEACALLVQCRGDQRLETGETQVRHLLSTADILVGLRMDADTLIAALFNGCLSRPGISPDWLEARFGPAVRTMVEDLHRIGQIANVDVIIAAKDQDQHEENLRRLLLGIAEDVRVVLIVLAERLHLMRSIKHLEDRDRQKKLARDTQRVYAPLANRLGIWQLKWELEDLALRYLEPQEYKRIAQLLGDRRAEREAYINAVIQRLKQEFAEKQLRAEVTGRPKHIYSIWKKMQRKGVDFRQIFDLRAVRVLVDSVPDCYAALGIVHGLWKHIPKEFDDYIATPKGNHYQSLHTAVIGPENKALEVQIRTWEMHRHAEFGVAAHWAYKENRSYDLAFQRRINWMRSWLELKNEGVESGDLLAQFKAELEPAHVYVLTPKSKVIELPKGATVLDFAFAIHSEIGNHCRGARVDGRIVPLNQVLRSGQMVEIITQRNATPSRDWLDPQRGYLTTAKARNRVRQWFKQQDFAQHVNEGRALLEKACDRSGTEGKVDWDAIGQKLGFQGAEELFAAVGRGELFVGQVVKNLAPDAPPERAEPEAIPARPSGRRRKSKRSGEREPQVIAAGIGRLPVHLAHCCKPIPPESIVGYITRGHGVTVHHFSCKNVQRLAPAEQSRLLAVNWAKGAAEATYPVDLVLRSGDRRELIQEIIAVLAEEKAHLRALQPPTKSQGEIYRRFSLEVEDLSQLDRLITKLKQLPSVSGVWRERE